MSAGEFSSTLLGACTAKAALRTHDCHLASVAVCNIKDVTTDCRLNVCHFCFQDGTYTCPFGKSLDESHGISGRQQESLFGTNVLREVVC